jgi:transcriptional regulator with XRE-family HTH domain
MATRLNPIHEAVRLTSWHLVEIGREVRVARMTGGRTQQDVARSVRTSRARISRFERGQLPTVTFAQLGRITGAVGLRLYVRAYPAGRRLLDEPQLSLLAELRRRAHPAWRWETEVPMPIAGDLRAADARATIAGCSVVLELWTRLVDVQAQTRAALLKARDLHADRVVLVLRASRANRAALRQAGAQPSFPLTTRPLLQALADAKDPGENGILLL